MTASHSITDNYDLVVIGAGAAGEKAATHAAHFGHSVAVVERSGRPGGVVVSNAGVPTKTLRETALYITGYRRREVYGVRAELDPGASLDVLRRRTAEVVEVMTRQVERNLDRPGITMVHGSARLTAQPGLVEVNGVGGTRYLQGGAIILAPGSHPWHPDNVPFDDPDVHDSESILRVTEPFASVVVVGGSAVGCEYASIFRALDIDVTLVELDKRLLSFVDHEIAVALQAVFGSAGMNLCLGTGVTSVTRRDGALTVTLADGSMRRPQKVFFAAGRATNSVGLGLDSAGVGCDAKGRIIVDEHYTTTVPGVYAAGDVVGPPALASVSMEQGRRAASHALDTPFHKAPQPPAPYGVYAVPEVAGVGMTEAAARAADLDVLVGRAPFSENTRAVISGATDGLVKLVARRDDHTVLGAHIMGDSAGDLVHIAQAVMRHHGDIDYFLQSTFNVPTYTSAFKDAAFDALRGS